MLDKSKLEELFRLNYSKMVHLARVLLPESEEAEDVVQDIFVRVADADLPPQSDAYLMIAVRHACLNRIRQMQLHEQVKELLPVDEETEWQPADQSLELVEAVMTFVEERLEEPHRSIFHLRFDEDLTIADIAKRLNLNPNTTYKYLIQSIQQIKNHFKKY